MTRTTCVTKSSVNKRGQGSSRPSFWLRAAAPILVTSLNWLCSPGLHPPLPASALPQTSHVFTRFTCVSYTTGHVFHGPEMQPDNTVLLLIKSPSTPRRIYLPVPLHSEGVGNRGATKLTALGSQVNINIVRRQTALTPLHFKDQLAPLERVSSLS